MCDEVVKELLRRWGVPQLVDRCREQEVDIDALSSFSEDVISELVPMIGPRCKFLKGWRAWSEAGFPSPASAPSATPNSFSSPSPRSSNIVPPAAGQPPPPQPQPKQRAPGPAAPAAPPARGGSGSAMYMDESLAVPSSSSAKREVDVFLEGKIIYEEGDSSSGWLSANGYLSTSSRGPASLDQESIKAEVIDDETPTETETGEGEARGRRPRFQLHGRISLSVQDFVEVPSFMLSSSAPMLPQIGDGGALHQFTPDGLGLGPGLGPGPGAFSTPTPVHTQQNASSSTPRAKRARDEKLDLEALLNASSKGKMILSLYQQKGALDGPSRQTLTDLIIAEELREDFNRRITSQRFQEIAETIVALFPGENEDTYFANDRSYGDRPGGKGKLTSKYYNTRRQLAKSGVISRGFNKERKQIIQHGDLSALQYLSPEESQAAHQNLKWVQSLGWQMDLSPEDYAVTLDKWRGCWKLRMVRILSPQHQPAGYVDDFRLLRMPFGDTLINSDFDMLFKSTGNRLISEWPQFSSVVISALSEDYRKQIPLLDQVKRTVTAEGKHVGALLLLPSLLPVTTCRGSGENGELWRPTRQEAQDGFLLHVEHEEDLAPALGRHWARMQLMGHALGPLPVVVGDSLDQLHKAFVAIDENTVYYVADGVRAVDLCFKCFHALQVPYPPQAANAWMFLQHALYQVATPADRISVSVSSLLADFGYRPVAPVVSWDQVLAKN